MAITLSSAEGECDAKSDVVARAQGMLILELKIGCGVSDRTHGMFNGFDTCKSSGCGVKMRFQPSIH